jgi:threonine dehydrogenase-like Zn-dependent dehydrogenase
MKALFIRQPGEAIVDTTAEPAGRGDHLLLRVRMVGMCGSDLNSFRGKNPLVSFPRIPGHEVAATIVEGSHSNPQLASGVNVTMSPYTSCGKCASCRRGRPNACQYNQTLGVQRDGAMTEFITMPEEKLYPSTLSLKELCMVEPLAVAFHSVARGRVTKEDTVAVFGCGGIGLGVIAGCNFRGARTIAVDIDAGKLALATKAGANETINSRSQNVHDSLRDLTHGLGPDVIVEAIGHPEMFRMAVEEVAFTGRVVYIGYAKDLVSYETRLFVQKELDILGSRNALPEDFRQVIGMLEARRFPVEEAVTSVIPLDLAPEALREWDSNPSRFNKIMVNVS